MFTPRFSGSEMWSHFTSPVQSTRNTPRLCPLDEKKLELENLKKEIADHQRELDRLYIAYMDWFKVKVKNFLLVVQEIQIRLPRIVPQQISSIDDFLKILEFSERLKNSGKHLAEQQLLDDFRHYWDRFAELNSLTNREIYPKICAYCDNVTRLRHPEVKQHVDYLHQRLLFEFRTDFEFNDLHNERDNLFTYNLSPSQQTYLGLVQYIPYLLQCARKMCYVASKLNVEVE